MLPVSVQPANSISATRLGSTQRTFFSSGGALSPWNGLFARVNFLRCGRRDFATSRPYPVPMRPT